jgi:gamma-glutamylputrescine oxidase
MGADDQSAHGSTWYSGTTPLPLPRAPLNYDLDVDVCVIGGGLAGLTAAREVARRRWSVAVVEARRVAWSASGRNGGAVLPGFSAQIEKVIERIGLPATKVLWELSQSGVQYIRDGIADIDPAGIMEGSGCLDVFKTPQADRVQAKARFLEQEMGIAAETWPTERVRDVLRTTHYFEALHFPDAFQINPLAYAQGLADAAERAGVRIFENTPASAVDLAGIRKRIETPKGRVRAGHVVLAGNIHLDGIAKDLADTLIPLTAFTGVTYPFGERLAHAVRFRGAVTDSRHANDHYRIVGRDRLAWTGSVTFGTKWARKWLEHAVRSAYPQLGAVQFEYFWPVETGYAVHRMPQIGEVRPGVWLASGFGGQGLNTSAMAGNIVARAIVEGDDTWRRFLPFELVWAGGPAGRAVARTTAWWWRKSEAAAAFAARQREELQRKRQGKKRAGPGKAGLAETIFRPGYNPIAMLKRALKSSARSEHDRPIDAPEAMPSSEGGLRQSQTSS